MAYMIYQQYTTAIKEGYADHARQEVARQAARARSCREWLESLEITPSIRSGLIEQMRTLEAAFEDVLKTPPATDAEG